MTGSCCVLARCMRGLLVTATPRLVSAFRPRVARTARVGCLVIVGGCGGLWAQDMAMLTTSQLQQQAQHAVERQQFEAAVPALAELERRFGGSTDPAIVQARESILYFLGLGRLQAGEFAAAAGHFREFAERYPTARSVPTARLLAADCAFYQSQFAEARESYDALRRDPAALGALDATQVLGLFERLSDCCFAAKAWTDGDEIFRTFADLARRHVERTVAAEKIAKAESYRLQAAIGRDDLEAALTVLPRLAGGAGASRYDLALNLALVRGGDAWYERGAHAEALHFYEQVLRPDELRHYWETTIRQLEQQQLAVAGVTFLAGRRQELEQGLAKARQHQAQLTQAMADPQADYTGALFFRIARCYLARERTFEAYWAFTRLRERASGEDGNGLEEALYGQVVAAAACGQADRTRQVAQDYLADRERIRFLGEVVQELAHSELRAGRAEELEPLWRDLVQRLRVEPELSAAPRVLFALGSTLLAQGAVATATELLEPLREQAEKVSWGDAVHYWLGLAAIFTGRFAAAAEDFEAARRLSPEGPYAEDAAFRLGVCAFGQLEYADARTRLEAFARDYPESRLLSEAHALLGDLAAADGRVEDALIAYRAAEAAGAALDPPHVSYITHAVFQGSRLLAANSRWNEVVSWLRNYIDRWGASGKLSEALLEIGRAQDALGQHEQAVEGWFEAILRFGNDPADQGADLMLAEYLDKYQALHEQAPVERLQAAYDQACARGERALAWRLWSARLDVAPETFKARELTLTDFPDASAAVLVAHARRIAATDLAGALAAVDAALSRAPGETVLEDALHLAGELRAAEGDVEGALSSYRRAADEFPASRRAAVARLREGDLLRQRGEFDAAIAAYRTVLQTRQWRGPAWAEANFKTGLAHLESGQTKEAFAFWQRVYVLYGSMAEWAAPAYLQSGRALESLGRPEDAVATYRELLAQAHLSQTPSAREAAERLVALQ